ncbi:alkaline phosphatase D family protein [Flavihumibacter solisilvae]|uniref:PhoD-like phosphatase metallophosphatase domain-containing protein n=1 Tax=Flavihumibacter solisilvae TaxID=1349421 RepID=A0A0C1IPJ3_9BACT|nr:alkaline phosphatase D family protein [Flavihumibacter solisilvae]KIC96130.1 hypothetical protein OI18_02910 [Flavihumibacter solisilvae]
MKRRIIILLLAYSLPLLAQEKTGVVSGPMLAQVELRTARIWFEAGSDLKSATVKYWKESEKSSSQVPFTKIYGYDRFSPMQAEIGGLEMNTRYQYRIIYNGRETSYTGSFVTKELWQFRKPAPDFSFLAGSCTYFNEPAFDRPGKPYGQDSSIFSTMANEKADFMLWLGDNWYTREADYSSEWGLWYRASRDRSMTILQSFLKAMPHYAIWDDHDFGPNDIGSIYHLKDASRKIFMSYWGNPSYGEDGKGIYTKLSYSDVDFFLTDDRTWRSPDRMPPTENGQPNPNKTMFGADQLNWLKQSLLFSNATFKVIAVGSQVLNPVSAVDKLLDFPFEYNQLVGFIAEQKISGVLFMTGDRHHSEIIKVNRPGNYPLIDITISPLTSGSHNFGPEKDNPYRIVGIDQKQNFGRISVTGSKGERTLTVVYKDLKGAEIATWSVNEKELKAK